MTFKESLKLRQSLDDNKIQLTHCKQRLSRGVVRSSTVRTKDLIKKHTARFVGKRLVHLDLKGAPPKMPYILKILPLLKHLGATGLLIEYEDMFPYDGKLKVLKSQYAYSLSDLGKFVQLANALHMEVIPLIPTFGHLEFVLKHKTFEYLREVPTYPNAPCPLHNITQTLVISMIDQVLKLHPNIKYIHIGGDEVYLMQKCDLCKNSGKSKSELYLHHMIPLFEHINRKSHDRIQPIIWDDMIRSWSVQDMKKIAKLTDIMVWGYVPKLKNYPMFPKDMWDRFSQAFKRIWIASSFKGALSPNNNHVPISMHAENHISWLYLLGKINLEVTGIALTGWSRFDHFASLCELLPAAIPSLAMCLEILKEGSFNHRLKDYVGSKLGFTKSSIIVEKDPFESWDTNVPSYPGGDVYALVAEFQNFISWFESTKTRYDSWMNKRQQLTGKVNMMQVYSVQETLNMLLPSFQNFRNKCLAVLSKYFYNDTVNEWMTDKVDTYIAHAQYLDLLTKNLTSQSRKFSKNYS